LAFEPKTQKTFTALVITELSRKKNRPSFFNQLQPGRILPRQSVIERLSQPF